LLDLIILSLLGVIQLREVSFACLFKRFRILVKCNRQKCQVELLKKFIKDFSIRRIFDDIMEAYKIPKRFTRTTLVVDATPDTIRKLRLYILMETSARLVSIEPEPEATMR
jgi:hypothetical protein